MKTSDNFPLNVGDKVWVRSNILDPSVEPEESIVSEIFPNKVLFDKPNSGGYIGSKLTFVFHKRENAYWNSESLKATGVFSSKELREIITGY